MCGSAAQDRCACCHGEGRRARERRRYARKKAERAAAEQTKADVRSYARQHRPLTPGPGVTIVNGTVSAVSSDPRWHEAQAGIAKLGPTVRTGSAKIIWVNVPTADRWMRAYENRPEPSAVRLPAGVVNADGTVNESAVADWPDEKVQKLHNLIRPNFRGVEHEH